MFRKFQHSFAALSVVALAMATLLIPLAGQAHGNDVSKVPAYQKPANGAANKPAEAVLAGGCFWGMEMVFQHVDGVKRVVSGYIGGSQATATYSEVSTGETGHAESIHIFYDPSRVTYATLLRVYFSVAHDPTQVNRQYPDVGPQYRSAIFALNEAQRRVAQQYIAQLEAADVFQDPIATNIDLVSSDKFYHAEDYHQNFGLKRPRNPYIQRFDQPKVAALERNFPEIYREQSVAASAVG